MEPDQNNQLDPQAVALAQAIRQTESGNDPTAQGKSGEYGAYQWTEPTWQKMSTAAGVNVPLAQATPEQQNEVAYKQIAQWKQQGYNVGQIASMWNAGEGAPNAYETGNKGTNAEGVPYDTSTYAENVANAYQTIKDDSQATPTPQQTDTGSGTPWWDYALLGGGALLAGAGAIAANVFAPEVAIPAETGAAAAAGGAGILSSLTGAAETGAAIKGGVDIASGFFGGNSSGGAQPQTPTPTPPAAPAQANESISPEGGVPQAQQIEQSMPQATKASQTIADAQTQALQGTVAGRKLAADQVEGIQNNGIMGLNPDVDENGNFDSSNAIKQSQEMVGNLSEGASKVLATEGATGNIGDVVKAANQDIGNNKMLTPQDQEDAQKHIQEVAASYARKYGDENGNIPLQHLQTMKQQLGHGVKWNVLDTNGKKAAYKSLSQGARKTIEKNTQHKDFYNHTMKQEQKLINGQKVLKLLDKKKAPKHKSFMKDLAKAGGGYLGLYIGDKIGGPLGAVLGDMIGNHIVRASEKRHGRTIFETKGMKAAMEEVKKTHPAVYARLEAELKKAEEKNAKEAVEKANRKLLPAPAPRLEAPKGTTEAIVTRGWRPPATFAEGKARKEGRNQGGLYQYFLDQEAMRKAAGLSQKATTSQRKK
jgi:hypothetical protein